MCALAEIDSGVANIWRERITARFMTGLNAFRMKELKKAMIGLLKPVGVFVWATLAVFIFVPGTHAAPVAQAGPDLRSAFNVPIILDGTGSSNSAGGKLTYLWRQLSGEPLEMIGQDRDKAMVISARTAGTYVFRLQVSNGSATAADDVTVTLVKGSSRVLYVDNLLSANCLNGNYSIANRNGSGANGNAYTTLQAAADASLPGDTIYVRGGTYPNVLTSTVYLEVAHVTRSGTREAPIRYECYPGERVVLTGFGYEDRDLNGDGYADGEKNPSKRETLFLVEADYIQVKGFEMANSQRYGMQVSGNFCYVEECVARDSWYSGFLLHHGKTTNTLQGTVFRWLEGYNNRHGNGSGLSMDSTVLGFSVNNAIVDCLFYRNGYQPNGDKVLPLASDPAGGGNSDGTGASKYFNDEAATVDNYGPGNFFVRNILYHNADDGVDTSVADSLIEGNMSIQNGPEGNKGYKMLRNVRGMVYRGNLAYGNNSVGFELRPKTGTAITVNQNTSLRNVDQGILGIDANSIVLNNLGAFNGRADIVGSVASTGSNWAEDGEYVQARYSGNPQLQSDTLTLNLGFEAGLSVREKWQFVESQIRSALSPKPGSGLIDQGRIIPGYHCPTADDDPVSPMPKSAPGRHWRGQAPDIGAFEFEPERPVPPSNLRVIK